MTKVCTVVWFRRDLRLEDNPALVAAARAGAVLPLYVWCPKEEGQFYPGRVSRWWLKQSLVHLQESLSALGAPLVMIKAEDTLSAILECIKATGATQIFYNHLYDPVSLVRDHKLKQYLLGLGFTVQSFNGDLLYEPWEVYDEDGQAFTSFDPYWKKCLNMPFEPEAPLLPPRRLILPTGTVPGCTAEELGLEHETEKSSNALLSRGWSPGWSNADKALDEFMDGPLLDYVKNRQKAAGPTTSLLSPHMHFGELSVRKIFHCVRRKQIVWAKEGNTSGDESVDLFLRAIGLREYSRYLCFNFPFTYERSLLHNLKYFPWRLDEGYFKAWRQGRTGYPLVDAGMRELWATGWIHNRIRVVVSSFCVKFLQLPWTWGMKYFWDTLLDADIENDILGWQYISGSLPDGHELDRMDSPQVQGCMFDPDGEYVRQWLPELARMPAEWIHHPWNAPVAVLKAAGVELGSNYPRPIVEMASARERLAEALAQMWELDANARAALASGREKDLGDTLEVRGTGGPLHERMAVPRVVIKKKQAPMSSSRCDQRVPSIPIARKDSCQKNQWLGDPQTSHQDSQHFSAGATEADTDDKNVALDEDQGEIQLLNPRTIFSAEDDAHSTAESSSARKRSINQSYGGVVPPWYHSLVGDSPEEAGLPFVREISKQSFNLNPLDANKVKEKDKEDIPDTHSEARQTKRHATVDH